MKKNKILMVIIVFLIILIIIGLSFTFYLYIIRENNNYVSISIFDNTSEVIEVNNNCIVPNVVYNYPITIKTEKEGKYKITINVINESIDDLEEFLYIEILFLNNIIYSGELRDLINNQLSFDYSLLKKENYDFNVIYYLKDDVDNKIQTMKTNFDFIITVKKERR